MYCQQSKTQEYNFTYICSAHAPRIQKCLFNSLQVVRRVDTGDVVLTEVVLSWSGRMLFAGGSSGCVRSLKFPLTEAGEFSEHQAHCAPVTRVCPSVCLSVCLCVSVSECAIIICSSVCQSVCLSACLSACLFLCLSLTHSLTHSLTQFFDLVHY